MSQVDLQRVKLLVGELANGDAFARRDAIESLAVLTQQRLDYRWSGSDRERHRAIKRWKRWIESQERERRSEATIQLFAGGKIDKAALEKALHGLQPAQKTALMKQVLAKAAALQSVEGGAVRACQECELRAASVRVTTRGRDGSYTQRVLCEVCLARSA